MSRQGLVPVNFFYYIIYYYLLCFNNQFLRPLKTIIAYLEYVYRAAVLCCRYCVMYKPSEPGKILQKPIIFGTQTVFRETEAQRNEA